MSTRERALGAAVTLLAEGGMRALTHGRVDDKAGLPKGSTSNFFRTRAALVAGVMQAITDVDVPMAAGMPPPRSASDLVDLVVGLFEMATGPGREVTTARLVLFTEAVHDSTIRDAANAGRAALEAQIVPMLHGLGAPDPQASAAMLMACAEGLILHRVTRGDRTDPRPVIRLAVSGALAS